MMAKNLVDVDLGRGTQSDVTQGYFICLIDINPTSTLFEGEAECNPLAVQVNYKGYLIALHIFGTSVHNTRFGVFVFKTI